MTEPKIKLIHGDCLDVDIEPGSCDMLLCDPPYGTTQNRWDTVIPLEPFWGVIDKTCKHNAAKVLTACQPFTTTLISSNIKNFRYDLVWHKTPPTGHLNANRMPMREHENICVFYNKLTTYNPQTTKRAKRAKRANSNNYGSFDDNAPRTVADDVYVPRSIIFEPKEVFRKCHPTQKPVALFEYLIKTYTNKGETVLDLCGGSGTTAIAAYNTGRSAIVIEKDDEYFEKMVKRCIDHGIENLEVVR